MTLHRGQRTQSELFRSRSVLATCGSASLQHTTTPVTNPGWEQTYHDLKIDLLQVMGEAVSYRFTSDYLRRQIYAPVRYAQVEQETEQIRQALAKALTAEGLKVLNPVPPEVQEELTRIRQALAKALTADGLKVVTREDQEARTDRPPR